MLHSNIAHELDAEDCCCLFIC